MKYEYHSVPQDPRQVAPFTGAWIEITILKASTIAKAPVAPFTGAWIEMVKVVGMTTSMSVAPFTGAWIEIASLKVKDGVAVGRTLHGCVD